MELFWIAIILGIIIGSALNALTYRWPRELSMMNPKRSFCPSCKKPLAFYELVPIFSFLIQAGKCRNCKSKISWRYPLGELGHGILWGLCALHFSGWEIVAWSSFCSLCWIIFWTDLENFWIPDEIGGFLFLLGIVLNGPKSIVGAGTGLLIMGLMGLMGLTLFRQDAIGHGDIKLMRGMGSCLLFDKILSTFFLAVFGGALIGVMIKFFHKMDQSENNIPPKSEGIKSYLKCCVGYLMGIDLLALFIPKIGSLFFCEDDENEMVETPIYSVPFGSFLILGGYSTLFFYPQIEACWNKYLEWVSKTL